MSTRRPTENIVVQQLAEVATFSRDAVLSGGWSYPVLGIVYFVSHPSLYKAVAPVLLKLVAASVGITLSLFFFTYLPQVAICALFSGPLAFVAAFTLVLGESYAIITFVSKAFFLGKVQDQIFDAVLLQQGHEQLVSRGRTVTRSSNGMKKLGSAITQPLNRFSKEGLVRYLVSLPLNALPVVGTVLFLLYNGIKAGPGFHGRYFQLKGLGASDRESFVKSRRGAYTAFGATALALNLVPVVGLVFGFTSTVGAALWASALEKKTDSSEPREALAESEVHVEL